MDNPLLHSSVSQMHPSSPSIKSAVSALQPVKGGVPVSPLRITPSSPVVDVFKHLIIIRLLGSGHTYSSPNIYSEQTVFLIFYLRETQTYA